LEEARNFLREGDILVVWRLDRLGRSLKGVGKDSSQKLTDLGMREKFEPF
jgi:DNA invertase Pin-like site-specific DNA recombinase